MCTCARNIFKSEPWAPQHTHVRYMYICMYLYMSCEYTYSIYRCINMCVHLRAKDSLRTTCSPAHSRTMWYHMYVHIHVLWIYMYCTCVYIYTCIVNIFFYCKCMCTNMCVYLRAIDFSMRNTWSPSDLLPYKRVRLDRSLLAEVAAPS